MKARSNPNEEKSNTILEAPTPAHLALRLAYGFYQEFTGAKYSESEIAKLMDLKDIYQKMLGEEPPVEWDLDDQQRPTKRILYTKRAVSTHQAMMKRHRTGQYNERSITIADEASNYLIERGDRRVGNGRPGDVLEQFFGEWIVFATIELPTYEYDEPSIKKLQLRIAYLEAVQRNESLFSFGTISRGKNKFGVMEEIKRELQKSINYANKESDRTCAREKLDICRKEMGSMLAAYARSIFFSRDHSVNTQSLKIGQYVNANKDESSGNNKLNAFYLKIKSTFSGAMLNDFINISGLAAFNEQSNKDLVVDPDKKIKSIFFNEDFSPTSLDMKKEKSRFDFAPWITLEMEVPHVRNHQAIMSAALHIAKLKLLVEDAYDLAGSSGNEWAYGDLEGKLPLSTLLIFLRQKLNEFIDLFLIMYNDEKKERDKYNEKFRVGPRAQINKNYNRVDWQLDIAQKNFEHISASINDILVRMEQFTKDDVDKIKEKKKMFCENVFFYVDNYNKRFSSEYKVLSENAIKNDDQRRISEKNKMKNVRSKEGMHDYFYSFDLNSKLQLETLQNSAFKRWKMNFVEKNKQDHVVLKKARSEFKNALDQLSLTVSSERLECIVRIKNLGFFVANQAEGLIDSAEYLMPVWRLGSLVITNPFKRKLKANLTLLINDLNLLILEVESHVDQCSRVDVSTVMPVSTTRSVNQVLVELTMQHEQKLDVQTNASNDLSPKSVSEVKEVTEVLRSLPLAIPKEGVDPAKNGQKKFAHSMPVARTVSSSLPKFDKEDEASLNQILNQFSV